MPLYEYRCLKCRHKFELIRKFSDPPLTTCIKCNGKVEKLMSSSSIAFKGTGWYVTDYGGKSGGADSGKSGGTDSGKGESKPESGSGSKKESATSESKESSSGGGGKKGKGKT